MIHLIREVVTYPQVVHITSNVFGFAKLFAEFYFVLNRLFFVDLLCVVVSFDVRCFFNVLFAVVNLVFEVVVRFCVEACSQMMVAEEQLLHCGSQ